MGECGRKLRWRASPRARRIGLSVTESTHSRGRNRIVLKSVPRVIAGEGRTRREELNDSGVVLTVSIVDPVAGTSLRLQPDTRTAYGNESVFVMADPAGSATQIAVGRGLFVMSPDGQQGHIESAPNDEAARAKLAAEQKRLERQRGAVDAPSTRPIPGGGGGRGRGGVAVESAEAGTTTHEDLGRQSIEGVPAAGSRVTTILAAGAIGNEQPIKSVAEQWFSPDLQVVVLTKHSDPRQGETTYRLSNIVRAEPDRRLCRSAGLTPSCIPDSPALESSSWASQTCSHVGDRLRGCFFVRIARVGVVRARSPW